MPRLLILLTLLGFLAGATGCQTAAGGTAPPPMRYSEPPPR